MTLDGALPKFKPVNVLDPVVLSVPVRSISTPFTAVVPDDAVSVTLKVLAIESALLVKF